VFQSLQWRRQQQQRQRTEVDGAAEDAAAAGAGGEGVEEGVEHAEREQQQQQAAAGPRQDGAAPPQRPSSCGRSGASGGPLSVSFAPDRAAAPERLAGELRTWDVAPGCPAEYLPEWLSNTLDFVVVFGGDGTVLWTCHMFGNRSVPPLVPFNLGSLGFLTPFEPAAMRRVLGRIVRGEATARRLRAVGGRCSCPTPPCSLPAACCFSPFSLQVGPASYAGWSGVVRRPPPGRPLLNTPLPTQPPSTARRLPHPAAPPAALHARPLQRPPALRRPRLAPCLRRRGHPPRCARGPRLLVRPADAGAAAGAGVVRGGQRAP
jgi:hypothetical protein